MATENDRIVIGSDHAGFALKEHLKRHLDTLGIPYRDVGAATADPQDDYPVYASRVGELVSNGTCTRGIGVCGAGIGASITLNRFVGVRAALCTSVEMAQLSRKHNDSNVIVFGGRLTRPEEAAAMLDAWLKTGFEGGRHQRRVEQMDEIGRRQRSI